MDETRAALRALLAGSAGDREFSRVAMDVNIAYARSLEIGGGEAATGQLLDRAGAALDYAQRMRAEHGRYGCNAEGRLALCEAVDLWEEVLRASSPRQMKDAEAAVLEAARRGRRRQREPAV